MKDKNFKFLIKVLKIALLTIIAITSALIFAIIFDYISMIFFGADLMFLGMTFLITVYIAVGWDEKE